MNMLAFDKEKLLLYVSIRQNFKPWAVPFYHAPVKLVTVLQLTRDPFLLDHDVSEPSTIPISAKQEKGKEKDKREKMKISFWKLQIIWKATSQDASIRQP